MGLAQGVLVTAQQRRQQVVRPVEQLAVQSQREPGLREVVSVQMQIAQLVHVPDVHLFAVDLAVEILYNVVPYYCLLLNPYLAEKMLQIFMSLFDTFFFSYSPIS